MAEVCAGLCTSWQSSDKPMKQENTDDSEVPPHQDFRVPPPISVVYMKQENVNNGDMPMKKYLCNECTESFPKAIKLAAHVRLCHTRPYSCPKCNKAFYHQVSCEQHMKKHDATEKPFKCNMCSRAFILKMHLEEHKRTHFGDKPFTCKICSKSFRTYLICKQHVKVHSKSYEYVTCHVCFKKLRKQSSLAVHLERHAQRQEHICTQCGKVFGAARLLTAHRRTHIKPFACNICDRRFTARYVLNKHLANHSDTKMLFCIHCCKSFSLQRSLTVHLRTHEKEHPFLCASCGKGFAKETDLEGHCLSGLCENSHVCAACGRSFKSPWGLARHVAVHSKTRQKSEMPSKKNSRKEPGLKKQLKTTNSGPTPVSSLERQNQTVPSNVKVCGQCYLIFTKRSAYTKHVLKHWRTSKSACSTCLKRFSSHRILSQHYMSHAKVHKCPHCSVTFTRIPILTKHMRAHKPETKKTIKQTRTLRCRKCRQICSDERSYVAHTRILCSFAGTLEKWA